MDKSPPWADYKTVYFCIAFLGGCECRLGTIAKRYLGKLTIAVSRIAPLSNVLRIRDMRQNSCPSEGSSANVSASIIHASSLVVALVSKKAE